jgi:heparinase II/III-like protein
LRIRALIARTARMNKRELAWRAASASRIVFDRARTAVRPPRWHRRELATRLRSRHGSRSHGSVHEEVAERVGMQLRADRFDEAHHELSRHFARTPERFVIGAASRTSLAATIHREFPHAERQAAARADRVLFGNYDLLGYRALRFDSSGRFEWNYDPVHDRRAPDVFWASVPFLDPAIGDHKIIWELNRHQHWITLGRAYWLTNDAKYRDRCLAELASWLGANPPLAGVNWASMLELAFRTLSWIWALHLFVDPAVADQTPWTVDLLLAIDRQLTHIERNLSYYFSPNTHLSGEALALYVSGRALPELTASARREAIGRRILLGEIDRQVAGDGGHCERSAQYHRYTLDYYMLALIVARATHDPVAPQFERVVDRLADATRLLADDRGRLPHLGDDDGGSMWMALTGRHADDVRDSLAVAAALVDRPDLSIGPAPEEAYWLLAHPVFGYARRRPQAPETDGARADDAQLVGARGLSRAEPDSGTISSAALPDTGYYISRSDEGTHLVIDGGPHGFQNGGHAHADALSMTMSVRGLPLLIDPGTGCYTVNRALRDRMRSTAMHNTVTIDGRSQSIACGPFHWTHTANASVARWRTNDGFDYFDGAHDGYAPLVHRRHLLALHRDLVIVADLVEGGGIHRAAAHWHFDPRWSVDVLDNRAVVNASTERIGIFVTPGSIETFCGDDATGLGWFSPAYGRIEPTRAMRVTHHADAPFWIATVFDLNKDNAVAAVDRVPVWAEAGMLAHSLALRITREASTDYLLIAEPSGGASTWRVAEFETDARMLFCRTYHERQVTRLALVDGSLVRSSGRRGLQLVLPRVAPDLHLDLSGEARIAGASFGARLVVSGRECSMIPERRAAPRT